MDIAGAYSYFGSNGGMELCLQEKEAGKVKDAYGKSVEVAGKNMVVDIKGEENETTIILLPGWGSPSPVLEFLPLAEQLSEEYRVVTIEPVWLWAI